MIFPLILIHYSTKVLENTLRCSIKPLSLLHFLIHSSELILKDECRNVHAAVLPPLLPNLAGPAALPCTDELSCTLYTIIVFRFQKKNMKTKNNRFANSLQLTVIVF